jgi:MFS family permease
MPRPGTSGCNAHERRCKWSQSRAEGIGDEVRPTTVADIIDVHQLHRPLKSLDCRSAHTERHGIEHGADRTTLFGILLDLCTFSIAGDLRVVLRSVPGVDRVWDQCICLGSIHDRDWIVVVVLGDPQTSRGTANAFLDAASKLGPSVGLFLGGIFLVRFDWRIFFIVLGVISLAWLVPWFVFTSRTSSSLNESQVSVGSIRRILSSRSSWGTFAGHFCGNYVWFFLLIWLPSYLVKDKGLSTREMANVGSIAFLVIAIGTLLAGWMSDRYIRRGISPTIVRKSVVVGGLLGSSFISLVGYVQSASYSLAILMFACFAFGTYTSNHWAITQTIAGPGMAGRWTGVQNGIGNFSGIVASWLTGELATRTGSFRSAFIMTGFVALAGACIWGLVVGPVRELTFEEETDAI